MNIEIPENPKLSLELEMVTKTTPVGFEIMNRLLGTLIENDAYFKKEKADKIHQHPRSDINNLLISIKESTDNMLGKYTRLVCGGFIPDDTGVYARYQIQIDFVTIFEVEWCIQPDTISTEGLPRVDLYTIGCPQDIDLYAVVWKKSENVYITDLYIKISTPIKQLDFVYVEYGGNQLALGYDNDIIIVSNLENESELYKIIEGDEKTYPANLIEVVDSNNHFSATKLDGILEELYENSNNGNYVGSSPPEKTSLLWTDTSIGGVLKYFNGIDWVPIKSVWG